MRSALIVTTLICLLIVGYLGIRNMDSHTRADDTGRVEEIEQAREAAAQANESLENLRKSVNLGEAPALP